MIKKTPIEIMYIQYILQAKKDGYKKLPTLEEFKQGINALKKAKLNPIDITTLK